MNKYIENIINKSCKAFGANFDSVMAGRRHLNTIKARRTVIYHLQKNTTMTFYQIADIFGMDRTSINAIIHSINTRLEVDKEYRFQYEKFISSLK